MKSATATLNRLGVREQYHKWVWLMLLLLAVRFVIVPVLDWQREKLDSIEFLSLQTRSPDEIEGRQQQISEAAKVTGNRLEELIRYYRLDKSLKEAELKMARQVEAMAQENGLVVTSRSWTTEYETQFFAKQQVRLGFEGYIDQLQPFLMELEAHRNPLYFVDKLDINNRGGNAKFRATLTVSQLTRLISEEDQP